MIFQYLLGVHHEAHDSPHPDLDHLLHDEFQQDEEVS